MNPHKEKPAGPTAGESREQEEPSTLGLYPVRASGTDAETVAALEREAEVIDEALKFITSRLKVLMLVEDEIGTRAARAYEALTVDPYIPAEVWMVAKALALTTCSVIYKAERADRARFAKPLREVLNLAAEITKDSRRAA